MELWYFYGFPFLRPFMTLVWISKPVVSRIDAVLRRKPCHCRYLLCICAFLCHCRSFNLSLCLLSPLLSYVAVTSRPCPLSAQPINLVNRKVLHKTRVWHLRNFTDLQTFKEEPREHDNAINHFRDHTLYNIPRRRNIGQRDISCMTLVLTPDQADADLCDITGSTGGK